MKPYGNGEKPFPYGNIYKQVKESKTMIRMTTQQYHVAVKEINYNLKQHTEKNERIAVELISLLYLMNMVNTKVLDYLYETIENKKILDEEEFIKINESE